MRQVCYPHPKSPSCEGDFFIQQNKHLRNYESAYFVKQYVLLFEMTVVVVLEACKVVAVTCVTFE